MTDTKPYRIRLLYQGMKTKPLPVRLSTSMDARELRPHLIALAKENTHDGSRVEYYLERYALEVLHEIRDEVLHTYRA